MDRRRGRRRDVRRVERMERKSGSMNEEQVVSGGRGGENKRKEEKTRERSVMENIGGKVRARKGAEDGEEEEEEQRRGGGRW